MPLKPDKGVEYLRHAAKLCRSITDSPVFQLQQVRQFGLIQLADGHCHIEQVEAFFDGGEMMLTH